MVIHLASRSVAYPAGFIEDVLVLVGELIFPVDFYVLNMEEGFFPWFSSNYFKQAIYETNRENNKNHISQSP